MQFWIIYLEKIIDEDTRATLIYNPYIQLILVYTLDSYFLFLSLYVTQSSEKNSRHECYSLKKKIQFRIRFDVIGFGERKNNCYKKQKTLVLDSPSPCNIQIVRPLSHLSSQLNEGLPQVTLIIPPTLWTKTQKGSSLSKSPFCSWMTTLTHFMSTRHLENTQDTESYLLHWVLISVFSAENIVHICFLFCISAQCVLRNYDFLNSMLSTLKTLFY